MVGLSFSRALRACAALALVGTFLTAPALADTVTLSPATWREGVDGGSSSTPRDGQFDTLWTVQNMNVSLHQGSTWASDTRALYEFVLPSALLVPGTVINSANLTLTVNLETLNGGNAAMVVHGYLANDAVVTVDDFEVTNPVAELSLQPGNGGVGSTRTYYIPYWFQTLPGGTNPRIGLIVATNTYSTSLRYNGPSAQLTIDYTPPVGTPPELTIIAPANNLSVVQGTVVTFQGTAFDAQDGDRSWGIQWQSNINGFFGNGGWFETNQLGVGNHTITASVYDYDGNVSVKTRNLTVVTNVNTPPTVVITAPANGATVYDNFATVFTASTTDAEQGPLNGSVQWWFDGTTLLGTTASLSYTVPAGVHTMTARVTDNGGLTAEQTITINSIAQPPPPEWCSTLGANATFNWLQTVSINGATNNSGNNAGFYYFPFVSMQLYKGVTNQITLTPGTTGGGATQWWSIWVDFNNDNIFSASELVTQGSSIGPTTRAFFVPNMTDSIRRMRVAMHTNAPSGPCGTFPVGEAEDYSVYIMTPPVPPPPPPAAYCSSRGSSTGYEFIRGTTLAGVSRTSNNNSGYADFTTSPAINLARGSNPITLTPGFGSGLYTESWRLWVDLNRNNLFESNESLYTGASASVLNGQIVIPPTALAGNTRLRVQMKYGSSPTQCETFSYGEVEDYLVNIAP